MWRVCRVMRARSLETVRALRGVVIVRAFVVNVCSFAWFVSFPCCFVCFGACRVLSVPSSAPLVCAHGLSRRVSRVVRDRFV